jgi:hypothetical protein
LSTPLFDCSATASSLSILLLTASFHLRFRTLVSGDSVPHRQQSARPFRSIAFSGNRIKAPSNATSFHRPRCFLRHQSSKPFRFRTSALALLRVAVDRTSHPLLLHAYTITCLSLRNSSISLSGSNPERLPKGRVARSGLPVCCFVRLRCCILSLRSRSKPFQPCSPVSSSVRIPSRLPKVERR